MIRALSLGRGGSHNTFSADFSLREEVILLHRLRRLITGLIPVMVDLRFRSSSVASLKAELRRACALTPEEARAFHL
ncbi:hypothetical protein HID58_037313 [Brassica napus]|uniref:Uncharacterized protein n=1 Tax=Brassica napus TaxID=3708 RepID=A0ABQ8BKY3_BRANA|nr:hypothetical protein HID58_037313 [Brassica napus]